MADPFFASAGFAEILKAAGLGDMDMDAFRMLEDARQLVQEGEMDVEEYEELSRGVQLQLLQLATNGAARQAAAAQQQEKEKIPRLTTYAAAKQAIKVPKDEKPIIESVLHKLPVVVSGGKAPEDFSGKLLALASPTTSKKFEKKYCVLYKQCIIFYDKKGDRVPKGRIDLTGDFFVQDSNEHAHGFVLSDMNITAVFGADTEELKSYWIHMCAMVLRKLTEPEKPTEVDSIRAKFQSRLNAFKKDKPDKRRQSMFFRRKQQKEEEELERQAQLAEAREMAQELRNQEVARQKELEELERQLKLAQEEKDRFRTEAELEHERAEKESARAKEEEMRRNNAERLLAKTLEDLRAESLAREEALLEEKEEILRKMQATMDKRRKSMLPGAPQATSEDFEKWEKERKALQAKLNALMDALNVDLGELEWDGTLEDAEQKMKDLVPALCSEDEKVAREAQVKFDQYDKVIRNHADYKAREEQKWVKWEEDNMPKNLQALEEMKRIVPHEVLSGISEDFLTQQCKLTLPVAKRVMTTKIYAFYYMDADVIAKLHIADLSSRYVCQGLDIRELRAVYYCLPKEFLLDPDGRKKLWRDDCRNKLKQLTDKEEQGKLSKAEQMHMAFRPKEEKKPAAAMGGGGARPPNPMAGALAGMLNKKAEAPGDGKPNLANLFANRGPPPPGVGGEEEGGAPRPNLAAMLAGRKPPPSAAAGGEEEKPSLAGLFANRGPPPPSVAAASSDDPSAAKLDTSALQNALAGKMTDRRERGKSTAQVEALIEMIRPESSRQLPVNNSPSVVEEDVTATRARKPSISAQIVRKLSATLSPSKPAITAPPAAAVKKSLVQPPAAQPRSAPPPMLDLGFKFNSAPQKDNVAEATALFNKATGRKGTAKEENLPDVPTYDFEGQTTARRKTWVDDGIAKLVALIEENGQVDKAEGGKKTATFGVLFDKFGPGSDMLVGILMRARKKGKVKYVGDMLFKGVHDNVKITIV